jgi:hypothetical protein
VAVAEFSTTARAVARPVFRAIFRVKPKRFVGKMKVTSWLTYKNLQKTGQDLRPDQRF